MLLQSPYKHGRGKVGSGDSVAAPADSDLILCSMLYWLPLTASINICHPSRHPVRQSCTYCCTLAYKFPPDDSAQSLQGNETEPAPTTGLPIDGDRLTVHRHWCHIASTVAYAGRTAYCTTVLATRDFSVCRI